MHLKAIFRTTFSRCLSCLSSVSPWRWLWLLVLIPIVIGLSILALQEKQGVRFAKISPDGKTLAIIKGISYSRPGEFPTFGRGMFELWDLKSHSLSASVPRSSAIGSPGFSPDGRTLAVGSTTGEVSLWDVETGRKRKTVRAAQHESGWPTWVEYSRDGRILVCGQFGIQLLDANTGKLNWTIREFAYSIDFSKKSNRLMMNAHRFSGLGSGEGTVTLSRAVTVFEVIGLGSGEGTVTVNRAVAVFEVAADGLNEVGAILLTDPTGVARISPDGQQLAISSAELIDKVRFYDVESGQAVGTLFLPEEATDILYSADGTLLATLSVGGRIDVWDVAARRGKETVFETESDPKPVRFVRNGELLASVDAYGITTIWNWATGQRVAVLDRHRWWAPQFAALVIAFVVWMVVWVWSGIQRRRSWQPLIDVLLLHAVILGIAYLRLDRGGISPDFTKLSAAFLQASAASLICLLIVWVVFAGHRWPFRLAGLVTGFAVFWGSMILCWNATNGLDSEIFGASVYLFGCQIAWCKMMLMQLRGTRLVFASDAGTDILGGQRRRQFTVQDVMVWFSAVALLLAVARFASPGWMPWQLCALVAVIGFTQAATVIVIFGLVERSPACWIPCVSVPLVAVMAGSVPRLIFDQIKPYHPEIWWHIGLNVAFAALLVVSLSILRCHGYRLAKPAAIVRSGQLAPSQDLAV